MTKARVQHNMPVWRLLFVCIVVVGIMLAIGVQAFDLQVLNNEGLQDQGNARSVRYDPIAAHRGNIMDRNGQPLAISTPVQSLWLDPKVVQQYTAEQWQQLADGLNIVGISSNAIKTRIGKMAGRSFMYIKRRMLPVDAQSIIDLGLNGVYAQEEYKRYYPLGEVAAHLVGLADSNDVGQEGMELAYEDWLQGSPGSVQVLKDRKGGIVREVGIKKGAEPGKDLILSIDSRIQFLAYKALKSAVTRHQASTGTAVVLDVETGEVLAMVSQPSYNPNNRSTISKGGEELRNRVIADALSPGSTVKAFTMMAALESGIFNEESIIDTAPGCIRIDGSSKCDPINYAEMTLERILTKSSQVGAIKVGLALGQEPMLEMLSRVGFGQPIGSGFPGEASGILTNHSHWSQSDIASMAYGYGFQVSPLQLAQAYMAIANGGIKYPISLLKAESEVDGRRIFESDVTQSVTHMLETVVVPGGGGTGTRANIPSYRVAGKTGTIRNYNYNQGYDEDRHTALFVGFAPASNPKVVTVVTIQDPKGQEYGGGQVAAPVFSEIVAGAMRVLNVAPDNFFQNITETTSEKENKVSVSSSEQQMMNTLPKDVSLLRADDTRSGLVGL